MARTASSFGIALVYGFGQPVKPETMISDRGNGKMGVIRPRTCGRCGGQGGADAWKHTGWTCYQCSGKGTDGMECLPVYTAEAFAKLEATRAKRNANRQAKVDAREAAVKAEADAKRAAFEAQHAAILPWLRAQVEGAETPNEFLSSLLHKGERYADWSEAQVAALHAAKARQDEREALRAASVHVGTVGVRMIFTVTVERSYEMRVADPVAHWLTQTLYITTMRNSAGNVLVVKSTSFGPAKGAVLRIKGTVKEHSEYKGEKQTILSRVVDLEADAKKKAERKAMKEAEA